MGIWCKFFGHSLGKTAKVYTNFGFYEARLCSRCDARVPVSNEDAAKKAASTAYISSIMNGERARFGLRPISWGD